MEPYAQNIPHQSCIFHIQVLVWTQGDKSGVEATFASIYGT